jgi:hypothetical protein
LVSFQSITTVNGKTIEVRGEARGDSFVITTPSRVLIAPSHIYTASPWSAGLPEPETMVVPEDGTIEHARVVDEGATFSMLDGTGMPVRHYEIISNDHYDVWSSLDGVPIRFGIRRDGNSTNFVLRSEDIALVKSGLR